jgi:hypothetical protein
LLLRCHAPHTRHLTAPAGAPLPPSATLGAARARAALSPYPLRQYKSSTAPPFSSSFFSACRLYQWSHPKNSPPTGRSAAHLPSPSRPSGARSLCCAPHGHHLPRVAPSRPNFEFSPTLVNSATILLHVKFVTADEPIVHSIVPKEALRCRGPTWPLPSQSQ